MKLAGSTVTHGEFSKRSDIGIMIWYGFCQMINSFQELPYHSGVDRLSVYRMRVLSVQRSKRG